MFCSYKIMVSSQNRYYYPLTSFSRMNSTNKSTPAEPPKSKVRKKAPGKITKLLFQKKDEEIAWVSPKNISELTVRCCEANTNILDIEGFFIKEYDNKRTMKKQYFPSTLLYTAWIKEKNDQYILQLLMEFESLLKEKDKIAIPLRRANYVSTVWRILNVFETCLEQDLKAGATLLNNFSLRCKSEHSLNDIELYLALATLQSDKEISISESIHEPLAKLTRSLAYLPGQTNSNQFPRCLQYMKYESMLINLIQDNKTQNKQKISFLLSLSALQWQKSNFSSGLDSLSNATGHFFNIFSDQLTQEADKQIYRELCVQFSRLWFFISNHACSKKMGPAVDYLLTQAEYFQASSNPLGFLPSYFLFLAAEKSQQNANIVTRLQNLPYDRSEVFEQYVSIPVTTNKNKLLHINQYVDQVLTVHQERLEVLKAAEKQKREEEEKAKFSLSSDQTADQKTSGKTSDSTSRDKNAEIGKRKIKDDIAISNQHQDMSQNFQKEVLDVKLIELAMRRNGTAVMDAYFTNIKDGLCPGKDAVDAIIQLFSTSEDLDSLDLLFKGTPESFQIRNLFYNETCQIQLRNIIKKWKNGEKLDAWIEILEFYLNIMNDRKNNIIDSSTSGQIILKCRQFCKLIIEDNIRQETQFLAALRIGSLKLASDHRDVYLLLTLWEALFFSMSYDHQTKAEQLLEELPQLVQFMKIDAVIARAEKYQNEPLFRKLIEINLKHNGSDYNKSRSFEALLKFLTQHERVVAGDETLQTAKSLNIRITADYMTDFLKMRRTKGLTTGYSIISALKNLFPKKKDV